MRVQFRSFLSIAAMLTALFIAGPVRGDDEEKLAYAEWMKSRPYHTATPETVRFGEEIWKLDLALHPMDSQQMDAVLRDGSAIPPELSEVLPAYDVRAQTLREAVLAPNVTLPEMRLWHDRVPEYVNAQTVAKVWVTEAMRRMGEGDIVGAIERWTALQRMAELFYQEGQSLLTQLVGLAISGLVERTKLTATLLSHPKMTPELASGMLDTLSRVEEKLRQPKRMITGDLNIHGYLTWEEAQEWLTQETFGLPQLPEREDVEHMHRGIELLRGLLNAELAKDFPARSQDLSLEWNPAILDHESLQPPLNEAARTYLMRVVPDYTEAAIRNDVTLARIRMSLIRAAEAAAVPPNPSWVDPFTGKAFGKNEKGLFSAGPDGVLGNGTVPFTATNGLFSEGDVW